MYKTEEYKWLYEVSNNAAKQAIKSGKELDFTDFEDFPRLKSKRRSKVSLYHDTEKLKVYETEAYMEKVGKVTLAEHSRMPICEKYTNPRITHDCKYWYISVCIE